MRARIAAKNDTTNSFQASSSINSKQSNKRRKCSKSIFILLFPMTWCLFLLLAHLLAPNNYQKYDTITLNSLHTQETFPNHLRYRPNHVRYTELSPFRNIYIAANFYNSEDILHQLLPEIGRVAATLHASKHHHVFVSLQENGSTDKTGEMLRDFGKQLNLVGIANKMVTTKIDDDGDWRKYCIESQIWESPSWDTSLPKECYANGEVCRPPTSLRKCEHGIRIPVMATIRNKAMASLSTWKKEMEMKNVRFVLKF